jgi:hypothetical protein
MPRMQGELSNDDFVACGTGNCSLSCIVIFGIFETCLSRSIGTYQISRLVWHRAEKERTVVLSSRSIS